MAYTLPHPTLVCVYHPVVLFTKQKNQTARQQTILKGATPLCGIINIYYN